MSILTFRNAYLSKVNARLNAVDVANAKDTDLLIYGALFRNLDNVNKVDVITIDGLRFIETMSAAELDEYALDPSSRSLVYKILQDNATASLIAQQLGLMTAIASSVQWLKILEQSGQLSVFLSSPIAMNAIASSTAGKTVLAAKGWLVGTASTYAMASSKILASMLGLNPADYNVLTDLTSDAIAGQLATNSFCAGYIGYAGNLFETFKVSSAFCAKTLAIKLNLNPASFADMTAFAASSAAVNALCNDDSAFAMICNMNVALTALLSNYSARSLLWASERARNNLTYYPNSFAYLQSIASNADYNLGNYNGTKKVWILKAMCQGYQTGGTVTLNYLSGNNTLQYVLNVPFPNDGVVNLKANRIEISNSTTGGTNGVVRLSYIQMEA